MDKFRGKYRIPSTRLQKWDYGWNAPYFVTICTTDRNHYLGKIINGEMHFSEIGELANKFWHEIPNHFPFVILDAFQVMPNHIHGILIINKTRNLPADGSADGSAAVQTRQCLVSAEYPEYPEYSDQSDNSNNSNISNNPNNPNNPDNPDNSQNFNASGNPDKSEQIKTNLIPGQIRYQNQGKDTLSSILGSYKSIVTKYAHKINPNFGWQARFHDHIIRDDASHQRIRNYIINNPGNWKEDNYFYK